MNRIIIVARMLALALLISIIHISPARADINSTPVCGSISSNTTWSLVNTPYDVCASGVNVDPGVTLTIDPGVTVQFEAGVGDKLTVQGSLDAIGTDTQPITLTAVVTTPGSWRGISADGSVATPAVVNLTYVTLEYGGDNGSYGAQVYADHAALTITHSLIRNGPGDGIYASHNTSFNVQKTNFVANGNDAIQLNTPSVDLLMTGLSASGNGADGIRIAGTTTWPGQRHWTNPGIPYIVDGEMSNTAGDVLTIDPGSVLQFTSAGFLSIGGDLIAQGTADAPIVMTGQVQSAGSWRGLQIYGGNQLAVAQLDYVTFEYGGSDINGANIELTNGTLIAHYSIIRNSSKDGIRFDSNSTGSILNSQIYGNALYGINNTVTTRAVLATQDWWGDAGGPRSDIPQCSSGNGDKVTAGVLFIPIHTDPNATVTLPLSDAPNLTLTPRRWFAPADGNTRIYFDVTLHDGNGIALPGRTVRLTSTLGTVTDGGVTDAYGKTLAYLTSTSAGDAQVIAGVDPLTACEGSLSPDTKVTFTTPAPFVDLMPDSASPYYGNDITVRPLPAMTGIPATIYARLTNPLTTTITVDVEFGFAQAGIGLVFGPIQDYIGQVIPPNSSVTLTSTFVPSVAGHYCVQVSYDITSIGIQDGIQQQMQLKQFNLNVQQSTTGGSGKDASLDKTRNSLKNVNRFVDRAYSSNPFAVPLAVANKGIAWDLDNAEKISNALQGDPPRQDYTQITTPVVLELPPTLPGNGISQARADALNAVDDALAQANAYGTAAALAFDRSGGATEAGDLGWASTQTGVMLQYNQLMGQSLIAAAQAIDNLIAVAASEGVTSVPITVDDVIAMQQKLASGFSPQEIDDAHTLGLTDADIEALRQSILTANPADLAGDVIVNMHQISADFYVLGGVLSNPSFFNPGYVVGSGGLAQAQTTGNIMAQVYNTTTTIQLSNPNPTTSLITLSARRIDLPADWVVTVSPLQISLDPGQQITVTVNILTGSPVAQGSHPRVAVEGYVNGQLLGGVVIDIGVPQYRPFNGHLIAYLPLTNK
jgi:Bacterial Ig-like domain (group 1)